MPLYDERQHSPGTTKGQYGCVLMLSFAFECYRGRIAGFYAVFLSKKLTETGLIKIPYKSFRAVTDCKITHKRNPLNLTISSSCDIIIIMFLKG